VRSRLPLVPLFRSHSVRQPSRRTNGTQYDALCFGHSHGCGLLIATASGSWGTQVARCETSPESRPLFRRHCGEQLESSTMPCVSAIRTGASCVWQTLVAVGRGDCCKRQLSGRKSSTHRSIYPRASVRFIAGAIYAARAVAVSRA
jgi:hypothetical protein